MSDLAGKVALVTGSSSGLGLAAARALAERGARVGISSRGGDKLERARAELEKAGAEVVAIPADLRDPSQLEELVSGVEEQLGPVDILVGNGGGPRVKPAAELDDADWEEAIPLVFLFIPRLCRLVLPGMRRRRWGRILAINSVSSKQPIPGLALSNSLRPAVLGYLKTLALEVAGDGVTINAILPGYTRTDRQVELATAVGQRTGESTDRVIARQGEEIPIRRMAEPWEIGRVIAFLCSPQASYLTGQAVAVDGGYVRGLL
ncbi:MAG: SDR family oxidoreductase [Thermoanaerobaculia bacterium]|nr:SDR family oxidoreductase [Thermoanaerobaculia bacterium]